MPFPIRAHHCPYRLSYDVVMEYLLSSEVRGIARQTFPARQSTVSLAKQRL
jgi:hypothetical protein